MPPDKSRKTPQTTKYVWEKVFQSGSSKICGRQPLKNLKGYGLLAVLHKFYLVHAWILCPIYYANVQFPELS